MTTEPHKHRPKDTQPFYLVGAGLSVLLIALAIPAVREWWVWLQMRGETHTAEAEVTALRPNREAEAVDQSIARPLERYLVTYRFDAPGSGSVTGQRPIDRSIWQSLDVGDSLTVAYAEDNPSYSTIAGDSYARTTSSLVLIVPLLGFAALWGSWEWEARRQSKKAVMRR